VHGLDDERAARPEHTPELADRTSVGIVAPVAERREQVRHAVEARVLERQLAVVRLDETGPLALVRAALRLCEQHLGAVRTDDLEPETGELDRVAAVPAGAVEHVRRRREPDEPRDGRRLRRSRGRIDEGLPIRPQVHLVEHPVPVALHRIAERV
jgi:hypothetical protein